MIRRLSFAALAVIAIAAPPAHAGRAITVSADSLVRERGIVPGPPRPATHWTRSIVQVGGGDAHVGDHDPLPIEYTDFGLVLARERIPDESPAFGEDLDWQLGLEVQRLYQGPAYVYESYFDESLGQTVGGWFFFPGARGTAVVISTGPRLSVRVPVSAALLRPFLSFGPYWSHVSDEYGSGNAFHLTASIGLELGARGMPFQLFVGHQRFFRVDDLLSSTDQLPASERVHNGFTFVALSPAFRRPAR